MMKTARSPIHRSARRYLPRARVRAWRGIGVAAACATLLLGTQSALATENGPAPTLQSTRADGPFAYQKITFSTSDTPSSFGGATIWYPTSTAQTYGGIAIVPGYIENRSVLDWYGARLASHGFVVISADPNSNYDSPQTRGNVLLAALDWLVNTSSVKARVDRTRLAVLGHSMGGGGVLEAVTARSSLKAGYALQPYDTTKSFPTSVPVAMVGGQSDTVAPPAQHAKRFYPTLAGEKAYLELSNYGHTIPKDDKPAAATYVLSWIKRWVDGDTRYTQFLCPGPTGDSSVSTYTTTCPF